MSASGKQADKLRRFPRPRVPEELCKKWTRKLCFKQHAMTEAANACASTSIVLRMWLALHLQYAPEPIKCMHRSQIALRRVHERTPKLATHPVCCFATAVQHWRVARQVSHRSRERRIFLSTEYVVSLGELRSCCAPASIESLTHRPPLASDSRIDHPAFGRASVSELQDVN